MTISAVSAKVSAVRNRSAWARGVAVYAAELLETLSEAVEGGYFDAADLSDVAAVSAAILNGAPDWTEYSWGGCSLIYDREIAERLCTPSELRKTRNGERRPNGREEWLDAQARALYQASERVLSAVRELARETTVETVVAIIPPVLPVSVR